MMITDGGCTSNCGCEIGAAANGAWPAGWTCDQAKALSCFSGCSSDYLDVLYMHTFGCDCNTKKASASGAQSSSTWHAIAYLTFLAAVIFH